jgi:hypothetical protein
VYATHGNTRAHIVQIAHSFVTDYLEAVLVRAFGDSRKRQIHELADLNSIAAPRGATDGTRWATSYRFES